jgi:hypothetical protein
MVYWVRTFRNTQTGKAFEVTSDEEYLPPLRRRIVKECGREFGWEDESRYEHEPGLDIRLDGEHPTIAIRDV